MELLELMRSRHSIRSYTDAAVADSDVEKIVQAGLLAASGKAIRPWDFIVVKDKDTMMKLADCRQGSVKMLKESAVAIAVIGDTDATDVWIEDCSVAMDNMHLMAHSLGLGSCWVQGRLRVAEDGRDTDAFVKDILGYPDNYKLQAILTVGHPAEERPAYELSELKTEKVHNEKF